MDEITAKGREEDVGNPDEVAEKIALGALHYFLLQATPTKDMIFNPQESLAFNGNTGPYIQYMGARIESMLRKAKDKKLGTIRAELLTEESEWELAKLIISFPELVAQAGAEMNPALIAGRLYDLSAAFSRFYHDCPILNHEDPDMAASRLELSKRVLHCLKSGMRLCLIPHLETM
jgi:arginyl-tRNA synthetase